MSDLINQLRERAAKQPRRIVYPEAAENFREFLKLAPDSADSGPAKEKLQSIAQMSARAPSAH